jgi:hypothetical protein
MFFTEYDDLFLYPAGATLQRFVDTLGWGGFWHTRVEAVFGPQGGLSGNLATFIAVEGMIFLAPFILIGLLRRLRDPFLWPLVIAALAIHAVFTFVFSFAGYRGALLHSAGALVPFWAVLGVLGVQDVIGWVAQRRRNWKRDSAMRVFGVALVVMAVFLISILSMRYKQRPSEYTVAFYAEVDAALPENARVFSVDPPETYALTGRGGAVVPNTDPENLPEVAARFDIRYLLLQADNILAVMLPVWDEPPPFLTEIPLQSTGVRLFEIRDAPSGS